MAHDININKGRASFFSAREVAWHRLGQVVDSALTSEEAIKAAGLDYDVARVDIYADFRDLSNTGDPDIDKLRGSKMPNNYATVRTDNRDILGLVGNRYEVVQNSQAFDFVDDIVGSKEAIFETAGALGKGERIFVTAKLPNNIRIAKTDDLIDLYFLFTSSHDGSGLITAGLTPVRVVCNNTLQLALGSLKNKITLKHTKSVHDKLKLGRELMGLYKAYSMEFSESLAYLATKPINESIVTNSLQKIIFNKPELELITYDTVYSPKLSTRKRNTFIEMKDYIDLGVGQEFHKGTALWLWNGVSSYYNNGKKYKDDTDRFDQLIDGTPMKKSQILYDELLQL